MTAAVFLAVFCVYAFCAYPTIAPRDSADLAWAALSLGVAHPPGYPLYATLGKAWLTILPWGDPAYRLNLLCAAAGAGAAAGLCALLRRSGAPALTALGVSGGLAFSVPLWKFSLLGEKYALQAFLIVCLFHLARGSESSLSRRAALSGLLFGLGLVNHQSLILLAPALAYLWRESWRRHPGLGFALLRAWAGFACLGLSLYAVVALRLKDAGLASSVLRRAEYGTFELFAGFSGPLGWDSGGRLLAHLGSGLGLASSPLMPLAALAAGRSRLSVAAALGLAAFGPLFFLMTRFDVSGWVAQSILETAFVAPTLFLCLLAGLGLTRLGKPGAYVALAAGLWPLGLHAGRLEHRRDFSAYDYVKDLRRFLPPDSAAVVRGDSALFGLRYLDLARPQAPGRLILSEREFAGDPARARAWLGSRAQSGRVFVLGLPLETLESWGLAGNPLHVRPRALAQEVASPGSSGRPAPPDEAWALSVLRRPRSFAARESYAHDIRLAYAFAHYLSGRLAEPRESAAADWHYQWAAALDPEDYEVEVIK